MKRFKTNRIVAILIVMTIYIVLMAGIVYYLVTVVTGQALLLSENAPRLASDFYQSVIVPISNQWQTFADNLPTAVQKPVEDFLYSLPTLLNDFAKTFATGIFEMLKDVPAFLLKLLIYLIAVFFVCVELPQVKQFILSFLSDNTSKKLHIVGDQLKLATIGYIKTQTILSTMTFIIVLITMIIIGAPFKILLSILITLFDILPVVGIGSIFVPWGLIAYFLGDHRTAFILFFVFLFVTIVRRIVEPKLLSVNIGISPLAALVSLYIGFELLGLVGVFLGPALVIIFNTLVKTNVIQLKKFI